MIPCRSCSVPLMAPFPEWILITVMAWIFVLSAAVLVLRAVLSEPLDREDVQDDQDVSDDAPGA